VDAIRRREHNREHIVAIEPYGKIMLGTILRYNYYEVRDEKAPARSVPTPRIPKRW
jgi:non-homologous end joining protein Ku